MSPYSEKDQFFSVFWYFFAFFEAKFLGQSLTSEQLCLRITYSNYGEYIRPLASGWWLFWGENLQNYVPLGSVHIYLATSVLKEKGSKMVFRHCDMSGIFGVVTALAKRFGVVSSAFFFDTVTGLKIRLSVIISCFGVVTSARRRQKHPISPPPPPSSPDSVLFA